jgi:two-component SAPR family response regulator
VQSFHNNLSRAEEEKNPEKRISFLLAAAEAYKGVYLPGMDADWAAADRHRYSLQYLQALHEISDHYFRTKEYAKSLQYCQSALQADNCDEEAYRASMQAHHAMGNLAEVARTFEQCKQTLTAEVGASPSPQTETLFATLMGKITA